MDGIREVPGLGPGREILIAEERPGHLLLGASEEPRDAVPPERFAEIADEWVLERLEQPERVGERDVPPSRNVRDRAHRRAEADARHGGKAATRRCKFSK